LTRSRLNKTIVYDADDFSAKLVIGLIQYAIPYACHVEPKNQASDNHRPRDKSKIICLCDVICTIIHHSTAKYL